jgi:hypothetical protein
MFTHPHSPCPTAVRSANRSFRGGPFWVPWPKRPKWAPTTVPFLGGSAHEGKSTLVMALTSPSHLLFSLSPSRRLSRYPLSTAVVFPPVCCYSNPRFRGHSPLPLVLYTLHCYPCPYLSTLLLRGAIVEDARPRVANEEQKKTAGCRDQ